MVRAFTDRDRVLVATDIVARGIDVPGIAPIANFDLPYTAENYIHRSVAPRAPRRAVARRASPQRKRTSNCARSSGIWDIQFRETNSPAVVAGITGA